MACYVVTDVIVSTSQALGKVGQVTKIDSDGDVVVTFGPRTHMFSPACCVPVPPATSSDSLTSSASDDLNTSGSSVASSSSNASGSSDNEDYGGEFSASLFPYSVRLQHDDHPDPVCGWWVIRLFPQFIAVCHDITCWWMVGYSAVSTVHRRLP